MPIQVNIGVENRRRKHYENIMKIFDTVEFEDYCNCTKEILAGSGQMYVLDERFKNNIDKHGKGTAEFISKAIEI